MTSEWTIGLAERLVDEAFPWGATVVIADSLFVALQHGVQAVEQNPDRALVWFARDPGDTIQEVSRSALELAAVTGRLDCPTAVVRQPEPGDLRLLSCPRAAFLGQQADSDDEWTARMRLHQSWWRAFRLRVPPGPGPTRKSDVLRGNMLDDSAAAAGRNFLSAAAKRSFDERLALSKVGVDSWRTGGNLLASQPLAFNLFGHLRHNLDLATAVFADLLGNEEVTAVTSIEVERLSDALGDRTAFDAFATYSRPDVTPGCIAIETKLTEPFSQQTYDWSKYIEHPAFRRAAWNTSDPAVLGDLRWSQLFRNHLLAIAETLERPGLGRPLLLVVHHPADPHCAENVEGYRNLLTDPSTVQAVGLDRIAQAMYPRASWDPIDSAWARDFYDRYLNLGLSEPLVALPPDCPASDIP